MFFKDPETILITSLNIDILKSFINNLGNSRNTFRYFENRDIGCINNHLVTLLHLEDGQPVCYGHLDKEGRDVWLGICVIEKRTGLGLGKKMMHRLTKYATDNNINNIKLSVDKGNIKAISLYENFGFKMTRDGKDKIFMDLNIGERNG
jgi:RimJ/RimL family protein N-acetyltransferase